VTDEVWLPLHKTKKDKVKVDCFQLPEHIRTNGLRCCYKREKEIIFCFKPQLSGEVFFYKEGNYGEME
jgi:hypothetical protein